MQRLVIFSEDSVYYDNSKTYKIGNPLTRLYAELGKWFSEVVLSGPVKHVEDIVEGYVEERIAYSPRPYYGSVWSFFKKFPLIIVPTIQNINKNVKRADVVMIRLPSPIGIIAYRLAKSYSKPYFLYIAGDIRKVVLEGGKYRIPFTRVLSSFAAKAFHLLTQGMVRNSIVFVAGSGLYNEFSPLAKRCIKLIPSLISKADIYLREDTCRNKPVQLLYVGRLVPVKGLRHLLEALKRLIEREFEVELQIVGNSYHKLQLMKVADRLGIIDRIHSHGRVAFGPALFKIYRDADIFVLPSLSEGLPKTLLEAMAFGLPIIATRVGGVSDIIENGGTGLLVEPRSPEALVSAVEQMVRNAELRRRIIQRGYEFAQEHPVERQAALMVDEIQRHLIQGSK